MCFFREIPNSKIKFGVKNFRFFSFSWLLIFYLEPAKLEQCKDSATGNCAAIAQFCNHPIHGQSIGMMCPATCGVCNGGAFRETEPVEECKDIQDNCERHRL